VGRQPLQVGGHLLVGLGLVGAAFEQELGCCQGRLPPAASGEHLHHAAAEDPTGSHDAQPLGLRQPRRLVFCAGGVGLAQRLDSRVEGRRRLVRPGGL